MSDANLADRFKTALEYRRIRVWLVEIGMRLVGAGIRGGEIHQKIGEIISLMNKEEEKLFVKGASDGGGRSTADSVRG